MTDKISQQPVPPLDPPERFAGGEVVAAARCPVDVSTYPRRHVIVVKHAGERQTFSVHEVAHNHVEWVGAARDITSLATPLPSGSWPRRWLGGHDDCGARPWTWSTAWQLRGVGSSEVGRVQALANAR